MKFYSPGEIIPYSGVYRVVHAKHHHTHEVTCASGDSFPECLECGNQVRFILLTAARSIRKHAMFSTNGASTHGVPSPAADQENSHT